MNDMLAAHDLMKLRTGRGASAATGAKFVRKKQLRLTRDGIGIVAPKAVQRAPLEEDRRADARPVVYREALYSEYVG